MDAWATSVSTAAGVHLRQESRHEQQLRSMRTEAQTVQTQHASEIGQLQSEKQALESENALLKRDQAKAKEQLDEQQCVLALPCAQAQIDLTVNAMLVNAQAAD